MYGAYISGEKGRSLPVYLDNKFYDDFEPGSADKFEVCARDVGELINITMELRSVLPTRQWHLDHVKVSTLPRTKDCLIWHGTRSNLAGCS
jgi:hypothetical protein